MPTNPPSISLVLLMYNEEPNIAAALDETLAWARGRLDDWEVIVVDDGSSDGGPAIVERYVRDEPRVRMVRHAKNRGMGAGMTTGTAEARKDYVVVMASDLQVPVAELDKLIALLDQADIILTVYGNRPNNLARTVMSRGFRLYMRALADIRFQLESFVLIPTAIAHELLPSIRCDTFFFSFEIVQRAIEQGYTVATATIASRPRLHGESKVATTGRIKQVAGEVLEYRRRRRSER
jgi:glycosyltransferase involved in cell wall biosynthesis